MVAICVYYKCNTFPAKKMWLAIVKQLFIIMDLGHLIGRIYYVDQSGGYEILV